MPLSEVIARINERFSMGITENDAVFYEQVDGAVVADENVQIQAAANDFERFRVGLDGVWQSKLLERQKANDELVYAVLDNPDLKEAWLARSAPSIYAHARVARQRTCPIGELLRRDGETRFFEYASTIGGDADGAHIVTTIAGFANSLYGGTLLVGVTDGGVISGLEDDYATFAERGERADRDLWGRHLKRLIDRLGTSAATLVDWEFLTVDGKDICRISIEPSDHPVFENRVDERVFWWRTPVGTERIDSDERDRIIARRWLA